MCNNFKKDLGKHLRKIRKLKGFTQETVFLESGVSRSHIAMIEAGKRDVSISALFKISSANSCAGMLCTASSSLKFRVH